MLVPLPLDAPLTLLPLDAVQEKLVTPTVPATLELSAMDGDDPEQMEGEAGDATTFGSAFTVTVTDVLELLHPGLVLSSAST